MSHALTPLQSWAAVLMLLALLLAIWRGLNTIHGAAPYNDHDLNRVDRIERDRHAASGRRR